MVARSLQLCPDEQAHYRTHLHANRPVCLGLIHNPQAGGKRDLLSRLTLSRVFPDERRMVTTQHESEVPGALRRLIVEEGVNVLAINGGDGTLHSAINGLWQLAEDASESGGVQFPTLLLLGGGTMNMASRAFGVRGSSQKILRECSEAWASCSRGELATRKLQVLRVQTPTTVRRGIIFGSEIVSNALRLHRHFGDGYLGLGRLLARASWGALTQNAEWERLSPLLNSTGSLLEMDGVTYPRYGAVVASTVSLQLIRGWVEALRVDEETSGFAIRSILETRQEKMVQLIPTLLRNGVHPHIRDASNAQSLTVYGGYTLDGELFQNGPESPVYVTLESVPMPIAIQP